MNHPAVKYRSSVKYPAWNLKPYALALLAAAVLAVVFIILGNILRPHHLLVVGGFSGLGLLSVTLNLAEAAQRKRAFRQLARGTKLNYESGSPLLGYPMRLSGSYRGRAVTLSQCRQSYLQASTTRLELSVENLAGASLRLRGPYHHSMTTDKISLDLFSAAGMRPVGDKKLFFVGGSPLHITTNLLASASLQTALETLPRPIEVELRGQTLALVYPSLVNEAKQVTVLLDILGDLADVIEQKSHARQRILAGRAN